MDPNKDVSSEKPKIYPMFLNIPPGRAIFLPYALAESDWLSVRGVCIDYLHGMSCILLAQYRHGMLAINFDFLVDDNQLDDTLKSFGEILSIKIFFGSKFDNPDAVRVTHRPPHGVEKKFLDPETICFRAKVIQEGDRKNIEISLLKIIEELRIVRHPNDEKISAVRHLEYCLKLGGKTPVDRLVIYDGLFWYLIPEAELKPRFETEQQRARFSVFKRSAKNLTEIRAAFSKIIPTYNDWEQKILEDGFISEKLMMFEMMMCLNNFDSKSCFRQNFISTFEYFCVLTDHLRDLRFTKEERIFYNNGRRPRNFFMPEGMVERFSSDEFVSQFRRDIASYLRMAPRLSCYLYLFDFYLLQLKKVEDFNVFYKKLFFMNELIREVIFKMEARDTKDKNRMMLIQDRYRDLLFAHDKNRMISLRERQEDLLYAYLFCKQYNKQLRDLTQQVDLANKKFNHFFVSGLDKFREKNYSRATYFFRESLYYASFFDYMGDPKVGDVFRYAIFSTMADQKDELVQEYFDYYLKFHEEDPSSIQNLQSVSLIQLLPTDETLTEDRDQIEEIFSAFMQRQAAPVRRPSNRG